MKKILLIGGGIAILVVSMVFGAIVGGPFLAAAASGNSNTPAATSTSASTNPYCQQYLQDLANRLHVSVSTLQQDKLASAKDVLAQLVKDGKLTQKQANAISQRLQSRQACTGKGPGFLGGANAGHALQAYMSSIASQVAQGLHLSVDQLKTQLQSGKSLSQIATAQHISSSQLHTIVTNAVQNALNQAVSAGNLTQQQATGFMQQLQSHPQLLNRLLNKAWGKANHTGTPATITSSGV